MRTRSGLTAALIWCALTMTASARSPNFILMVTDDQGYADLGCYGSKKIKTPHLDRMAGEGTRFSSYYSASSVCSPSRAAMMTGRYPKRCGVPGVLFPNSKTGLSPDEITIAEILQDQGYVTGCIGKWHLGHQPQFMPMKQGFAEYFGIPYSNDMSIAREFDVADDIRLLEGYTLEQLRTDQQKYLTEYQKLRNRVPLLRGNEIIEYPADQKQLTQQYTREAVQFIQRNREQPFLLYLPQTMPHRPIYASAEFAGTSGAGAYGDSLQEIDWCVGEILKALEEQGLTNDTLFVFTSDNGPARGAGGSAAPLRGTKFTTWEGGHRVPMIAWGPGRVAAGVVCDEMVMAMDMLPTLADYAEATVPQDRILDGRSLRGLLTGDADAQPPHDTFYYYRPNSTVIEGIRVGDWKFVRNAARGRPRRQPVEQLYNLADDIGESNNLIEQHAEKANELKQKMESFDGEMVVGLPQ